MANKNYYLERIGKVTYAVSMKQAENAKLNFTDYVKKLLIKKAENIENNSK